MYAPFFGLEHPPFSIAPDPRYLFMSERHREALAHLLYGLDAGGGFVLLTGEIGTGKTTVCRCFLEQIPAHCNVAYIFNPKLTVPELLRSICDEFGVAHRPAVPGAETVKDCLDPLNEFLLHAHAQGRNNVLIIDEAQSLAPDVLEQLRLLTNLETSERKLLQIILIGQPELRAMVARPELEQLAQRVIARYHLRALTPQETRQYIAYRLGVAGLRGPLPLQPEAIRRVHAITRGVPRRINLLCDRALLGAYGAGVREVSEAMVRQAALEVFGAPAAERQAATARPAPEPERPPRMSARMGALVGGMAGVLTAAAVAVLGWALGWWPPGADGSEGAAARAPAAVATPTAPTAPAAAAAAAAPAPMAAAPQPSLEEFLARQPAAAQPHAAWRLLAGLWQAGLPQYGADPCAALAGEGLRCYQHRRASLNLLRQIDRPVLLTLEAPGGAPAVVAVLRQLDGDAAVLEGADGTRLPLPLAQLAPLWRGEIATLWRMPAALAAQADITASAAGGAWLDQQLARVQPAVAGATRQARIHQFQLAQGLTPDGQAGPLTLMMLNRATGVPEPRLHSGA